MILLYQLVQKAKILLLIHSDLHAVEYVEVMISWLKGKKLVKYNIECVLFLLADNLEFIIMTCQKTCFTTLENKMEKLKILN